MNALDQHKLTMNSTNNFPPLYRMDALTGVGNSLGFFEWLLNRQNETYQGPFTLIAVDINGLKELNENFGHSVGDVAVRWVAMMLQEESGGKAFRIGPDEFVLLLTTGRQAIHARMGERIFRRLESEADQVSLRAPAGEVAVVHFKGTESMSPGDILGVFYGAIYDLKKDKRTEFKVYEAAKTEPAQDIGWVITDMINRMVSLGNMLDESHILAYTDAITGLPNMRAALRQLENAIFQAGATGQTLSILLFDGDNLRKYNKVSYMAGDEMIERLGSTLKNELRPSDFVARWRMGDEFFVLLPNTPAANAVSVAERMRMTIERVSKEWLFPITISAGIVGFPDHGDTSSELLRRAEVALERAKQRGKNRVMLSEQ
jgi:diguanylate cyclase (GGDEF)-like protein